MFAWLVPTEGGRSATTSWQVSIVGCHVPMVEGRSPQMVAGP